VRFPDTEEIEFYDLRSDPLQRRSLHHDPAYADTIATLQKVLEEKMREVGIEQSELPTPRKQRAGKTSN
jgi:hypothetical protein